MHYIFLHNAVLLPPSISAVTLNVWGQIFHLMYSKTLEYAEFRLKLWKQICQFFKALVWNAFCDAGNWIIWKKMATQQCVTINHQEAEANKKCFSDLKKKIKWRNPQKTILMTWWCNERTISAINFHFLLNHWVQI